MTPDQILSMNKAKTEFNDAYAKKVFFANIGVESNGLAYVVAFGWNVPDIEDQVALLKSQGFRYNGLLKVWLSKKKADGIDSYLVDFNRIIEKGYDGIFHYKDDARQLLISNYVDASGVVKRNDGFVGEVGEIIKLNLTPSGYARIKSDSDFGDFHVFYFKDSESRNLSWFQRSYSPETLKAFMLRYGVIKVHVHGTVKRHITRLGVPMTDLTRCDISAKGHMLCDFAKKQREMKENSEK